MHIHSAVFATPEPILELDRLGNEIAELSAHLEAATARLLDLIREFDAREGWANGFRSCAAWLSWRVGFEPGAARERRAVVLEGPRPHPRGHARDGKSVSLPWAEPAPRSTSSGSCAAGDAWTASPRMGKASG